jgi:hypothetical protein
MKQAAPPLSHHHLGLQHPGTALGTNSSHHLSN